MRCLQQAQTHGEKCSIPLSQTLVDTLQAVRIRDVSGRFFLSLTEASAVSLKKLSARLRSRIFVSMTSARLVQNGGDLYKAKELLGHKTINMTMRYAHYYPESLRESVEVLDFCYKSATSGNLQIAES